nr:MAG TPA: hypothetical protein [Bacteriophage sp.]
MLDIELTTSQIRIYFSLYLQNFLTLINQLLILLIKVM